MVDEMDTSRSEHLGEFGRHDEGPPQETSAAKRSPFSRIPELFADELRSQGKTFFEQQKKNVLQRLDNVADAFHQTSVQLSQTHHDSFARYAGIAAGKIDEFSGSIREKEFEDMAGATRDFIRKQPLLVLGGGVAIGFLVTRVLKRSLEQSGRTMHRTAEAAPPRIYVH